MRVGLGLNIVVRNGALTDAEALVRTIVRRAAGYGFLLLSDPHVDDSSHGANVRTGLDWGQARAAELGIELLATVGAGDMNQRPLAETTAGVTWKAWRVSPTGGNVPASVDDLICPGNHDTEVGFDDTVSTIPADPFATLHADYADLFEGGAWWSRAYDNVLFLGWNDIADAARPSDNFSLYRNCCPGGSTSGANPDHSGSTVPGSPVLQWLEDATASAKQTHIVSVSHRPRWSTYNDTELRPQNQASRILLRPAIANRLGLDFCGDQHVNSLCGPFMPEIGATQTYVPAGPGVLALNQSGGYATRPSDDSLVPEGLLWHLGAATQGSGLVGMTLYVPLGRRFLLECWTCSDAEPAGSVKYRHLADANPGE